MSASAPAVNQPAPVSKGALWTGRALSAIPVLMMAMSAVMKFLHSQQVVTGMAKFGYPEKTLTPLGILEISCAILYAIPQTSVFGAVLVAAYLGGATATVFRVGDPGFISPAILGVMAWVGLWLREPRLRAIAPIRK